MDFLSMLMKALTPTNPMADKANSLDQQWASLFGQQGSPYGLDQGPVGALIGSYRHDSQPMQGTSQGSFNSMNFFQMLLNSILPGLMNSGR